VSGVIENISRSFTDTCGLDLKILAKNGQDTYVFSGREVFSGSGVSLCL